MSRIWGAGALGKPFYGHYVLLTSETFERRVRGRYRFLGMRPATWHLSSSGEKR